MTTERAEVAIMRHTFSKPCLFKFTVGCTVHSGPDGPAYEVISVDDTSHNWLHIEVVPIPAKPKAD